MCGEGIRVSASRPPTETLTPPLRRYESDPQRRDRFFYEMLRGCGTPPERCTPDVMRIVVQQHLSSPSCWVIFPMQVRGRGSGGARYSDPSLTHPFGACVHPIAFLLSIPPPPR